MANFTSDVQFEMFVLCKRNTALLTTSESCPIYEYIYIYISTNEKNDDLTKQIDLFWSFER